jgi:hypothetical protein
VNRRTHLPTPEAGHVLIAPDDVVAADRAVQKHIQGQGGGADVAVPEDEPAEQSRMRYVGGASRSRFPSMRKQEQNAIAQIGAGRHQLGAIYAVLVRERERPRRVLGHEIEHTRGQLVMVDSCVPHQCVRVLETTEKKCSK